VPSVNGYVAFFDVSVFLRDDDDNDEEEEEHDDTKSAAKDAGFFSSPCLFFSLLPLLLGFLASFFLSIFSLAIR